MLLSNQDFLFLKEKEEELIKSNSTRIYSTDNPPYSHRDERKEEDYEIPQNLVPRVKSGKVQSSVKFVSYILGRMVRIIDFRPSYLSVANITGWLPSLKFADGHQEIISAI